jgi:hypothetical protein
MRPVYVATRCPQGSLSLGDRSSASVTEVHDVDGALRVEDPVVKVIPAPPESRRRRSRKSALVCRRAPPGVASRSLPRTTSGAARGHPGCDGMVLRPSNTRRSLPARFGLVIDADAWCRGVTAPHSPDVVGSRGHGDEQQRCDKEAGADQTGARHVFNLPWRAVRTRPVHPSLPGCEPTLHDHRHPARGRDGDRAQHRPHAVARRDAEVDARRDLG